jgi:MiaB/RimO family radical SAM methylthiotransferase
MSARVEKVYVTTTFALCDNNAYSSTQISNFFACNGFPAAEGAEDADWIVISTCGFDQSREDEAKAIITGYIRRFYATKRIIVCGCLPKIRPELFHEANVITIGPKEFSRFNELFCPRVSIENVSGGVLNPRFISKEYGLLDCYYLQICQGCVNHCSYCAIRNAKGHVTSVAPEKLVREAEQAIKSGFSRIMLLGDDCGSYGADLGIELCDLLQLIEECGVPVCINYLHPAAFLRLYEQCGSSIFRSIEFINVPIQATSQRVLGLMNRRYDVAAVLRNVRNVKAECPGTFLETHMIYGFPSETREEFEDSFSALNSFDSVIYFYYTDRKNTPASLLNPRPSAPEMAYRTKRILSHERFTVDRETATPPVLLLGYDLKRSEDIFAHFSRSSFDNAKDFVILGGAM